MDGHLKTTIEISDSLLRQARKQAAREGTTLRSLVERGLHRVIADAKCGAPFKLRQASFSGEGRRADFQDAPWETMRDLIYKDRGA
jgi:hypothetical protein